jgi:nucleoside-specific outer membrane channel protein Tsx
MTKDKGVLMFKSVLWLLAIIVTLEVQAVSVSVLKGDHFRNDLGYRSTRTTYTIENFSVWEYGTVFFYYDITDPTGRDQGPKYFSNQYFGGISPTLSLSKVLNRQVGLGFIKDISLRAEMENGSGTGQFNFQNYFYGLQYDLTVPGFDFFSLNTVFRDNPRVHGVGLQIGAFWQSTFDYGPWKKFKFTGFLATSPWDGNNNRKQGGPGTDRYGRYLTTQPQLLYDIGYGYTGKPNRIEIGVEYAYFLNRFQQQEKHERAIQWMGKFTF